MEWQGMDGKPEWDWLKKSLFLKKDNLFNILMKKYAALKQDIEYASLIKRHELEDRWDK